MFEENVYNKNENDMLLNQNNTENIVWFSFAPTEPAI